MNIYFSLSIWLMLLGGQSMSMNETNILKRNNTAAFQKEVTVSWIQGNWKIYQVSQGENTLFSRDVFRFFEDTTGFKGINQRLEWEFQGNILAIKLLNNNKTTNTYWWTSRDRDNNLILTRYAMLYKNGSESMKKVKLILERVKN